jgi:ADP-ribose pyrophosphatase YjhB (NUDIX family)
MSKYINLKDAHPRKKTDPATFCRTTMNKKPIRTILCILLFTCIVIRISPPWNYNKEIKNDMELFKFAKPRTKYPEHLTSIDPLQELKHFGFEGIDKTHRNGYLHQGAWIYVLDSSIKGTQEPNILLLKRGSELVTCPNKWMLIGEHTFRDESPLYTARRGLREEIGEAALDYIDKNGSIRKLKSLPVYYERDYGAQNGGRIDRQITYFWIVEMNADKSESTERQTFDEWDNLLKFDSEVADHKWMPLKDFADWVLEDAKNSSRDFCHETIHSFLSLGIDRLNVLREKREK